MSMKRAAFRKSSGTLLVVSFLTNSINPRILVSSSVLLLALSLVRSMDVTLALSRKFVKRGLQSLSHDFLSSRPINFRMPETEVFRLGLLAELSL